MPDNSDSIRVGYTKEQEAERLSALGLPATVKLNDLADFMESHPTARIVSGNEWPKIEVKP